MKIILGSKSLGRRRVLERAGYVFEVMAADIDERAIRSDDYEKLPLLLARAKAKALLPTIKEPAILITSDQVVVYNGELREKPLDKLTAKAYLASYGEHLIQTNTAVVVTNTKTGKQVEGLDSAQLYVKHIPQDIIDKLLQEGSIMHAAGGIIVEHPLMKPFVKHSKSSLDSITGLPLKLTEELITGVNG